MVREILKAAKLPHEESRFLDPPGVPYAVFFDSVEADGPDNGRPLILRHSATVELYAPTPAPAAERALEDAISDAGLLWTKQERYWLEGALAYQTIYEFDYIEKRRI